MFATRAHPAGAYAYMNGRIQTNISPAADVPRAVASLLRTTKQLQETLQLWSTRQVTESQVSDVYVRLGTEFNATVTAFAYYSIDLSELYSIPQELRTVLEGCLSQDASTQVLAQYMPQVRQILFNLLQGLRSKQPAYWRAVGGTSCFELVPRPKTLLCSTCIMSTSTNPESSTPAKFVQGTRVKTERSPSPAYVPQRKLVTSASKLYSDVPVECQKHYPGYKANRDAWAKREAENMRSKGLHVIRQFSRDDGMVIDWKSAKPVWDDTLEPEQHDIAAVIERAHVVNYHNHISVLPRKRKQPPSSSLLPSPRRHHLASSQPQTTRLSPNSGSASTQPQQSPSSSDSFVWFGNMPPSNSKKPTVRGRSGPFVSPIRMKPTMRGGGPSSQTPSSIAQDVIDVDSLSQPAQAAPQMRDNPPGPQPNVEVIDVDAEIQTQEDIPESETRLNRDPSPAPRFISPSFTSRLAYQQPCDDYGSPEDWSTDVEATALEKAALHYLEQYVRTFDDDRSSLASAYSRNATFSCQVPNVNRGEPSRSAEFAPLEEGRSMSSGRPSIHGLRQGRLDVISSLLSLGTHKFSCVVPVNVSYDVACLGGRTGVLLVAHGTVDKADMPDSRPLRVGMHFVLRPKDHDPEDGSTGGLWPLVAIAHQMTVWDLP
ncbi:hypothetical protein EW146_g3043 [Bondarzewia mesenterica]|uniref:NTF2 domain-containing protein n=1 Tax=Bondarzewia mesenterica TaxID=1095465 RepID=A0A4V3XFK6_9AGAM|nr:hypothetical protein EW146_g3043 [Bondarzewia mesenterica]